MDKTHENILVNSALIRRHASLSVNVEEPFHLFMEQVLSDALATLDVSRVSLWVIRKENSINFLECVANTDWIGHQVPLQLPRLNQIDFPSYFEAVSKGYPIIAHDAEQDPRTVEFLHSYLRPQNIKSMLDTIIFDDGHPIGVVCCEQVSSLRHWNNHEVHFAELVADCCTYRFMSRKKSQLESKLRNMAFHDYLTGLYNRRYFFESIGSMISFHSREGSKLTLAMIDLDDFKSINDTYGHHIGDEVLVSFTRSARGVFRKEDLLCRFGGEEFVVVFQGVSINAAKQALSRLQDKLGKLTICDTKQPMISFSAGISDILKAGNVTKAIGQADTALYKAKSLGKNRIEIFVGEVQ